MSGRIKKRRPSAPFYFPDWQSDVKLGACSAAARGVWMEFLCIMHAAEPRGFLVINGAKPSATLLAQVCRMPEDVVATGMGELLVNGVCSVDDRGVVFSRRMVREEEEREQARAWGKQGGNPNLGAPKDAIDEIADMALRDEERRRKKRDRTRRWRAERRSTGSDGPVDCDAPQASQSTGCDATVASRVAPQRATKNATARHTNIGKTTTSADVAGVKANPDPFPSPFPESLSCNLQRPTPPATPSLPLKGGGGRVAPKRAAKAPADAQALEENRKRQVEALREAAEREGAQIIPIRKNNGG